jgi:hypothetical protein
MVQLRDIHDMRRDLDGQDVIAQRDDEPYSCKSYAAQKVAQSVGVAVFLIRRKTPVLEL